MREVPYLKGGRLGWGIYGDLPCGFLCADARSCARRSLARQARASAMWKLPGVKTKKGQGKVGLFSPSEKTLVPPIYACVFKAEQTEQAEHPLPELFSEVCIDGTKTDQVNFSLKSNTEIYRGATIAKRRTDFCKRRTTWSAPRICSAINALASSFCSWERLRFHRRRKSRRGGFFGAFTGARGVLVTRQTHTFLVTGQSNRASRRRPSLYLRKPRHLVSQGFKSIPQSVPSPE